MTIVKSNNSFFNHSFKQSFRQFHNISTLFTCTLLLTSRGMIHWTFRAAVTQRSNSRVVKIGRRIDE